MSVPRPRAVLLADGRPTPRGCSRCWCRPRPRAGSPATRRPGRTRAGCPRSGRTGDAADCARIPADGPASAPTARPIVASRRSSRPPRRPFWPLHTLTQVTGSPEGSRLDDGGSCGPWATSVGSASGEPVISPAPSESRCGPVAVRVEGPDHRTTRPTSVGDQHVVDGPPWRRWHRRTEAEPDHHLRPLPRPERIVDLDPELLVLDRLVQQRRRQPPRSGVEQDMLQRLPGAEPLDGAVVPG